jgi:hypothetical protein
VAVSAAAAGAAAVVPGAATETFTLGSASAASAAPPVPVKPVKEGPLIAIASPKIVSTKNFMA